MIIQRREKCKGAQKGKANKAKILEKGKTVSNKLALMKY
jgi:hypothetical protein